MLDKNIHSNLLIGSLNKQKKQTDIDTKIETWVVNNNNNNDDDDDDNNNETKPKPKVGLHLKVEVGHQEQKRE